MILKKFIKLPTISTNFITYKQSENGCILVAFSNEKQPRSSLFDLACVSIEKIRKIRTFYINISGSKIYFNYLLYFEFKKI